MDPGRLAGALFAAATALLLSTASGQVPKSMVHETSRWLPFDDAMGLLFFQGAIAGKPIDGIVDTGVTITTLDTRFARDMVRGDAATRPVELNATGGQAHASHGPLADLDMAGVGVARVGTLVADLSTLARTAGRPIDAMVGLNVIGWGALDLDLGEKRWRFAPAGLALPASHSAPLRYTADHYYSFVTVTVAGRPLRLFVDTGYDGGLMLTAAALDATRLVSDTPSTTMAVAGLGGTTALRTMIPAELRFGDVTLHDLPVDIDEGSGMPSKLALDGMIGTALLARLHVVLDYPAGVMAYRATTRAPEPTRRTTIGLQLLPSGDRLTVAHAMANGPAARSGWQAGDTICAVDRVKVTPGQDRRWAFATAGTAVRFGMCDGTVRTLIVRRFY